MRGTTTQDSKSARAGPFASNRATATVLHSASFQALAAFVAVNTLAYAALSLAKLIPRRRS
jgi:hypothetical protein